MINDLIGKFVVTLHISINIKSEENEEPHQAQNHNIIGK